MNTEDDFVSPTEPPEEPPTDAVSETPAERPPPPPRPPRPKQPRTAPIFIVVLGAFAAMGLLVYYYGPGAELRPFKPHLAEYANTKDLKTASSAPVGLFGKVIILD